MSTANRLLSIMQSVEDVALEVSKQLSYSIMSGYSLVFLFVFPFMELICDIASHSFIVDNRMCVSCCSGHVVIKWLLQQRLQRSFVNQWRRR